MTSEDLIREMCFRAHKSMVRVSTDLGRSRAFLSTTIAKGSNLRSSTLSEVARECGYVLACVPISQTLPEGSLTVD